MYEVLGYTYIITQIYLEINYKNYTTENVRVYNTLKSTIEAIRKEIDERELSSINFYEDFDQFVIDNESKYFSPIGIADVCDLPTPCTIIVKCVYTITND